MSREIPEVVRAAAGLAATVLDEARKLPETLPGLPVRVIGLAMQTAMKVQQQYSGLVARGDELFTGIRGEHEPGLATFDDDDVPPAPAAAPGFRDSAFDRAADTSAPITGGSTITDEEVADLPDDPAADAVVAAVEDMADQIEGAQQAMDEVAIDDLVDGAEATTGIAPDGSASVDVLTPDGEVATVEGAVTDEGIAAPEGGTPAVDTADDESGTPVAAATAPRTDAARPAPIEGYDEFSIAQLRGRLRGYAPSTIEHLLEYEQQTRAREPYLRMLRNRLERVRADGS